MVLVECAALLPAMEGGPAVRGTSRNARWSRLSFPGTAHAPAYSCDMLSHHTPHHTADLELLGLQLGRARRGSACIGGDFFFVIVIMVIIVI